jgi:hypothetical protein
MKQRRRAARLGVGQPVMCRGKDGCRSGDATGVSDCPPSRASVRSRGARSLPSKQPVQIGRGSGSPVVAVPAQSGQLGFRTNRACIVATSTILAYP